MFLYMIMSGHKHLIAPHILFLYGKGGNGKTTLLNILKRNFKTRKVVEFMAPDQISNHEIYIVDDSSFEGMGKDQKWLDWFYKCGKNSLFIITSNITPTPDFDRENFTYIECPNTFKLRN